MGWKEEYQKYLNSRQGPRVPSCFLEEGNGMCARPVIKEGGQVSCGHGNPSVCPRSPFREEGPSGEVGGPKKTRIFDGGAMRH